MSQSPPSASPAMANGVIPPPGGASPLPQVTDASGWGMRRERPQGGEGRHLADPGTPLLHLERNGESGGWGGEEKGVFCYFSDLLPRLSKPWELGRWSQLGALEAEAVEDGACWSPPRFHPGFGVGGVGRSRVQGP